MGDTPVKVNEEDVHGTFVELEGERFYRISHFDRMPDFFMSIVSASDHWMFISSNGSLTAGRKNAESPCFLTILKTRYTTIRAKQEAGH